MREPYCRRSKAKTTVPSFNILQSTSIESDKEGLCKYIRGYGGSLGLTSCEVDEDALTKALTGMNNMPWGYGFKAASPFKKVSVFATNFALHQPIITPFPKEHFGELCDHQNAIVAYNLSVFALHNAEIVCPFRGPIRLEHKITVSRHFWKEFISALSHSNPIEHFNFVSLVFESLCYQVNPDASFKSLMHRARPEMVV